MPDNELVDRNQPASGVRPLSPGLEIALVSSILLLALGVRVTNLQNEAAWYDEIITVSLLDSPTLSEFLSRCQELTPIPWFNVYEITEYAWARLAGTEVTSVRMLSVLYGIGSLLALYVFTRSLLNTRTALIALAWTAFMPWHIYISQEIRFYSLVSLLSILSMHSLMRMSRGGSAAWFVLNCALNASLVWTHILTVFLPVAQGLFLISVRPFDMRKTALWAGVNGVIAIHAYATPTVFNAGNLDEHVGWIRLPSIFGGGSSIASYVRKLAGHSFGTTDVRPFTVWGEALYPAYPILKWLLTLTVLGAAVFGIHALLRRRNDPGDQKTAQLGGKQTLALLGLWFFVPLVCAIAASFLVRPMFVGRYMLYAAYPAYVLIGFGLSRARSVWIPTLALSLPMAMYFAFQFPGPYRVPFDRIVDTIAANAGEGDVVLTQDRLVFTAVDFHSEGRGVTVLDPSTSQQVLDGRLPAAGGCWILLINPAPEHVSATTESLAARGTVDKSWRIDALRAAYLWRWQPHTGDVAQL